MALYTHNCSVMSQVVFVQMLIYYFIIFAQTKFHTQHSCSIVPADHTQHDRTKAAELLHGQVPTIILLCSFNHLTNTYVSAGVNHPCGNAKVESKCS